MTNRYTTSYGSYNLRSRRYHLRKRVSLAQAEFINGRQIPRSSNLRSYYHWIRCGPLSASGSHSVGRSDFW